MKCRAYGFEQIILLLMPVILYICPLVGIG